MWHVKHLKDMMEARETKTKNIHFRKNSLERQKVANCQNQSDRIKGELDQAELRGLMAHALKKRKESLDNLTKHLN